MEYPKRLILVFQYTMYRLEFYFRFSVDMVSLWDYLSSEATRGYVLEADEERYTARRQKMYTFMKIPRELEKFMSYGFFHCLDSFLFVFTFLPIRLVKHIITYYAWFCSLFYAMLWYDKILPFEFVGSFWR